MFLEFLVYDSYSNLDYKNIYIRWFGEWGGLYLGGGAVVCTAHFNDELTILKDSDTEVLVKESCGQGWVAKSKLEYVAQGPRDNTITIENFDIQAWIDNQSVFDVHIDNVEDFEGVTIDRDFREYLTYTIDREQTEMHNGEN